MAVAGRSRSPNGGAVGSLMNVSNVSQSSKACSGDIVVSGHAQPFKDVGTGALVMESKARCLGALYNGQDHIRWSRSALELQFLQMPEAVDGPASSFPLPNPLSFF